jgi:hypothetical protein
MPLACRFSMDSGWWRSRQVLALALNRYAGNSPIGAAVGGLGTSGSRKYASRAAAPAGSRVAVSSTMARACCQVIVPDCNAERVGGNSWHRAWDAARNAPAAREPRARRAPISAATAISCACTGASGPAIAWAVSAYVTAARAFKPANPASATRAPARMSRHPSASPASGSASENGFEPHSSTSALSTARAALMSSNALATAAFRINPSSQRGLTFLDGGSGTG